MSPHQREAHIVRHAVRLVDLPCGLHAARRRDRAQPVDVVLHDEQAARHDQGGKHVVVLGHRRRRAGVRVQAGREPDVLADNLARRLDVGPGPALRVADAPARGPARARLLRQRERDAAHQRAHDERALAVARAPRDAEARRVDARGGVDLLEGVDQPVDTPGPGRQGARRVRGAKEGVELALAAGRGRVLGGEGVIAEVDSSDVGGDGQRGAADGDNSGWCLPFDLVSESLPGRREGALTEGALSSWLAHGRGKADGLGADSDGHGQGVTAERALDRVRGQRVVAELVLLHGLTDLLGAAVELSLGRDGGAALHLERVGQLGIVDGGDRAGDRAVD